MAQISLGVAAEVLEISKSSAVRLLESGVLGPVEMRGSRRVVSMNHVKELSQRPHVNLNVAPRSLVVRVGGPTAEGSVWRSHSGWHESWTEERKRNAVRGDWKLRASSIELPMNLVILVGPIIVAVYAIASFEQYDDRLRFQVERATTSNEQAFAGKQLRLPPGPVLTRIGET